jgi:phosphopantothenoylcysteine decarboxylase / phosphopantothenate---cysteine ligase
MNSRGREIVLGVTGGISAYKSCDLLRRLQDHGFLVTVIPTRASLNFVGVATWEALSGREIATDLWNNVHQVPHVSIAKKADAIIIAPATADILAKMAHGIADDLLTNTLLASTAPVIVVPAMHTEMWLNPATVSNIETLRSRGVVIIEPETGKLTSGDVGVGRYPESAIIISGLLETLAVNSDLLGKHVLISAGGTREAIDPVRYIGNHSSGKQGYALAHAAVLRGARVTLVSANSQEPNIEGIEIIRVLSTSQMQEALEANFDEADILIMAAAVADVRPSKISAGKISKNDLLKIELIPNPDILKALSSRKKDQVVVGFAAQTEEAANGGLDIAVKKLREKGLDAIYFNDVSGGAIFGEDETSGVLITSDGAEVPISKVSKVTLANKILDLALNKLG